MQLSSPSTIKILVFIVLLIASSWLSYTIGYNKALVDALMASNVAGNVASDYNSIKATVSDENTKPNSDADNIQATIANIKKQGVDNPDALLKLVPPKKLLLGIIDTMPISYLANIVEQMTQIPANKIMLVANPRELSKKILSTVDSILPFAVEDVEIMNANFMADVQVSTALNTKNYPKRNNAILYAGKKKLFVSFDMPATYSENPYVVLQIKHTNPDKIIHYKAYKMKGKKRSYIWTKYNWLAKDYQVELFLLDDDFEALATSYFSVDEKINQQSQ